jgi:peptidoglycan hydrolase CwlO-like protein
MRIKFLAFIIVSGVLFAPFSFAQDQGIDRREELRSELLKIQEEINQNKEEIAEKQKEEKTLKSDIAILGSQVKKTELELQKTALALRATELSIEANNIKIVEFSEKINHEKEVIAELVRVMYEEDSREIIELIIESGDISDFFEHQRLLESIQASLHNSLQNLKQARANIETEQASLEEEKETQGKLKTLQEAQRGSLKNKKNERDNLLQITRGEKEEFERIVAQKERDVEQIRNQIFLLEGVGISMPLHKAYEIAKAASDLSGVRPAFLLAVLKQESSWGQNVGQCYLVDLETGSGKGKNTGNIYYKVMNPSRDIQPFLQITKELGRDPYGTLVSCPHPDYGYGGAMGPAQFIPSTWMAYKDRLADLLGRTPDPWDINDAFTASAIKLANGGASAQTPDAEWKAAMIYYAGSRWNNPVYSFYGDSVMELAAAIQEEINAMGE